ncbi:MAG: TetR family transcriptional regulator [Phycicoccus sp.]|nr:TetR family transcriptional regulator [Phycicoccus sp.]
MSVVVDRVEVGLPPTNAAEPASARERKKRETRARIHRAAVELALRGGQEVTVEEIAAAADVSARTFFNYFPTKIDALLGHDPQTLEVLAERLVARPPGEPLEVALRAVVMGHAAHLTADAELWRMRRELADRTPELAARISGSGTRLEEALVQAAFLRMGTDPATDIETGVTARAVMAAFRAALAQHRAAQMHGSILDRLDAAFIALSGVAFDAACAAK